jgi:type II secretory pathway pseudopilin PulG
MVRTASAQGFTLLETLIVTVLFTALLMVSFEFFQQHQKIYFRYRNDTEILQNARMALDAICSDLRVAGYHLDRQQNQPIFIEAAPFQIILNADKDPGEPVLIQNGFVMLSNGTRYINSQNYTTGAETIRWTLDSNDDGLIDNRDIDDNPEERASRFNDSDFVLIRELNGGPDQQVALYLRGPIDAKNNPTYVPPLFQYWILSPGGSLTLWGDTNGNGSLEGNEIYFSSITSQSILEKIKRITVTVSVESDEWDPFRNPPGHRQVILTSEVALRNNF